MSVLPVGISGEAQYQISRSLRFNSADSTSLSKTYSTSKTSNTTVTFSFWIKRSVLGVFQSFFSGYDGSSAASFQIGITSGNIMHIDYGGSASVILETTQVFRDVSSWYHFVVSIDTTQATSSNRIKVYVNGAQVTSFSAAAYPSLNQSLQFALTNANNRIGSYWNGGNLSNGYLTEVNFIDGQALTPSSFGETDPITGVWKPKKYTGTYGTNGFYLNFSDNSGTTSTTLGKDYSGNGNNWTPNNFSVTAGAGNDSLVDVPTLWGSDSGLGGETRGNYATWNPLKRYTNNFTISNGNLDVTDATSNNVAVSATIRTPSSGKWYWEVTATTISGALGMIGATTESNADATSPTVSIGTYRSSNQIYNLAGVAQTAGNTYTSGDVIGVAVDIDNGTCQFYKNGVAQGATPSFTFTAGTVVVPFIGTDNNVGTKSFVANFGQRPFAYTAPSGFKALCTTNLPEPSIKQGDDYFNAVLYTGTGAIQSVTGLDFQPDFVWLKCRSAAEWHSLFDSVRGALNDLRSNTTDAEVSATGTLTSFNSNGFSLGTDPSGYGVNTSTRTYVAWNWKANGTGVTNTAGSITSTVSANTTSGFSIVTYTGTGANATVGHGLGVAPSMVIVKNRTTGGTDWPVYHISSVAGLYLSNTSAQNLAQYAGLWNSTPPTSSLFSLGTSSVCNANTNNYVAYCFAPVAGFSAFGSYTGNGSTDGPFIYTGFRPRFVLIKRTDSSTSGDWRLVDSTRESYNGIYRILYPNLSDAESAGTFSFEDLLSNGFKLKSDNVGFNGNGATYIYAAFAESPFKYSLAR